MGYAMPGPPVPPPAPPTRRRRLPLLLVGALLLVTGIGVFVASRMRLSDGVTSLAAAPAGCETVLRFDGAGTYTFFVETTGELDGLDGDCTTGARDYDYDGDTLPRVSLTLVDGSGQEVDLDRVEGPSYDGAGRRGEAVRTAELDAGGDYVLTVDTNETELVVRVGKDPTRGVALMRALGVGLAVLGLLAVLAWLVWRRPGGVAPVTAMGPAPIWQPGSGPPPVAPPMSGVPHRPPSAGSPSGPVWPSTPPPPPPPRR